MAISLLLKSATGALFLNDSGTSNDRHACALQGFVSFPQGEERGGSQLRLESTGCSREVGRIGVAQQVNIPSRIERHRIDAVSLAAAEKSRET